MTGASNSGAGSATTMETLCVAVARPSEATKTAANVPVSMGVQVKVLWMGAVPLAGGKAASAGAEFVCSVKALPSASLAVTTKDISIPIVAFWAVPPATSSVGGVLGTEPPLQSRPETTTSSKYQVLNEELNRKLTLAISAKADRSNVLAAPVVLAMNVPTSVHSPSPTR